MTEKRYFSDPVADKVWDQYFRRLERLLRPLDEAQRGELRLEIKGHLLESFRGETSGSEAERLLNAVERLGEPEEFVRPMLAERLLTRASKSLRPKDVLKGLYYHFLSGVKRVFAGTLFVLGYLLVGILALTAVLKVFFPKHVGLLLFKDGDVVFGLAVDIANIKSEVFGYWIIPLALGLAFLLYVGLTKLLRVLKKKP